MRSVPFALLAIAWTASAGPMKCPPGAKRFDCHQLAMNAHLGLGGKVDLVKAKALYADACAQREVESCNNLGVLALLHPELATDVDPKVLFEDACKRLEYVACDNARRLATHRELAIELSLRAIEMAQAPERWPDLERAACTAGDVFRCEDAASRTRVATLLADECTAGIETTCFEAATRATDDPTIVKLLGLGCTAGDGKACHALATRKASAGASDAELLDLWKRACGDKDFDVTEPDASARSEACSRWGTAARKPAEQRSAAAVAAGYCADGKSGACDVAERLYDRTGDHAKAFAIVKPMCEASESPEAAACRDLGERYLLGNGTTANVARALELFGGSCPKDLAWESCKRIGRYLEGKGNRIGAAAAYESYCTANVVEACYLRARAFEADPADGTCGGKPLLPEIKALYDDLCTKRYRDSCQRSASMCGRAMVDFAKEDDCGFGMGDGVERFSMHYHVMVELCPKPAWTPAIRKAMAKIDSDCREAAKSGIRCER